MRWRVYLSAVWVLIFANLAQPAHAQQTSNQTVFLKIYIELNDADHLQQQGDFRGALEAYQDCLKRLIKLHNADPDWEKALVLSRIEDCKAQIATLKPKVDALPSAPTPTPTPTTPDTNPTPTDQGGGTNGAPVVAPPDVETLQKKLDAVTEELNNTKEDLRKSLLETQNYHDQVMSLKQQLDTYKNSNSQPVDNQVGELMSKNKALTDKLAEAQRQLDLVKSPKAMALLEAKLKNTEDQLGAAQAANTALQQTTDTLKTQLEQAQTDLNTANQKLASLPTNSPDYLTIKHENELMRDILRHELQEQARRDGARRLAQEEFDRLKITSKVLQEQFDIFQSPMTSPSNDEERALLASLMVPGMEVTPPPNGGNVVTAPQNTPGTTQPDASTNLANNPNPPAVPTPTDTSTNPAPVTVVDNGSTTNAPASMTPVDSTDSSPSNSTTTDTNTTTPASVTPGVSTPDMGSTNSTVTPPTPTDTTPSTNPPPTTPPAPDGGTGTVASGSMPPPDNTVTKSQIPPGTTVYQDTTIQNNNTTPEKPDPTQYANKARLPDEMKATAQEAANLFKQQRYDDAADKYQTIIDKYPESLYAWSNLGVVRFQQGKLNEALRALQQSVKLSPTDAFSYMNLGIVYYQMGQYENAIDALNRAIALDPNNAKAHNYLGCACSQKGWQEVAEKEFRKAIDIDETFADAHFNLALVYATSKPPSLELARRHYNRAVELGIPKDPRLEKLLHP